MAIHREFGREAGIYLGGFVIAGVVQFLAIPIYTRALGPEEYGHLTLTIAVSTVLAGVMLLGGDVTLTRFWVEAPTERAKRDLASTWIAFIAAWSVLVAAVAALLTPWLAGTLESGAQLTSLLIIGFFGMVPAQVSRMLAQILRNQFRPVPYAATTVAVVVFNVGLGFILGVAAGLGVHGVVLGMLLGETIGCLTRLPLVWGSLGLPLRPRLLPPLLRFGLPLVPASLAAWTFTGADRIVVGSQLSAADLGAYGLAASMVGPFTVFTLAMGQAWVPRIAALYTNDIAHAQQLTAAAISAALIGLGLAATVVGSLGFWLVQLIGGAAYSEGAAAVPFLALGAAFAGAAPFASTGLTLTKRTVLVPVATGLAALLDIALLQILVPLFGLAGAAMAVCAAYLAMSVLMLALAQQRFHLDLRVWNIVAVVALLVGAATVNTVSPGAPRALAASALAGILVLGIGVIGYRSRDRRQDTAGT